MCDMFFKYSVLRVAGVVLLLQCSFASSTPAVRPTVSGSVTLTEILQIPNVANAENLAVRHNGEILVTSTKTTSLFQISPSKDKAPIQVAQIPDAIGLLGIAELEQDVFYVVASSNLTGKATALGANSVWKVDMRRFCTPASGAIARPAQVSLVATILDAELPNGMCRMALNDTSNLLIADSAAGTVIRLDVNTAAYEIVIRDPTMANLPTGFIQVAVDGIHVHGSDLFYTSLNQGLFAKIPISLTTGVATGPAEVIVNEIFGDDFVLSKDGKRAWIAMNGQNALVEVDIPGKAARVIANSTFLSQDSSVAFGRTNLDRNSLYISGAGIFDNNSTVSASVVRADLPCGDAGL
ncbi:uncharacterized protein PAC_06202 [Phialocephala subalpina]|uniref:SMP-30/Gluconolactonase/LRE-like region domain-containing protein n=1 Tax=Phialocephala subalpina TaxID=576137 RepID=A0A1L7WU57_9HELO|nr:uncharacterized protein PAC_06202 [Phialocephala subalpina]